MNSSNYDTLFKFVKENANTKVDVLALAAEYYPDRIRPGQDKHHCLHPDHPDKIPSMSHYPKSNTLYCHSHQNEQGGQGATFTPIRIEILHKYRHLPDEKAFKAAIHSLGEERLGVKWPGRKPWKLQATYNYTDERHVLLYRMFRFIDENGQKQIRYSNPHGKDKKPPHVLFKLPDIIEADVVWLLAGEKDVLTAEKLGFVATTTAFGEGASKFASEALKHSLHRPLAGKTVYICSDNDSAGRADAICKAETIHPIAKEVRILDITKVWPEAPEKSDVSDMLELLGEEETKNRLLELINVSPVYVPDPNYQAARRSHYNQPDVRPPDPRNNALQQIGCLDGRPFKLADLGNHDLLEDLANILIYEGMPALKAFVDEHITQPSALEAGLVEAVLARIESKARWIDTGHKLRPIDLEDLRARLSRIQTDTHEAQLLELLNPFVELAAYLPDTDQQAVFNEIARGRFALSPKKTKQLENILKSETSNLASRAETSQGLPDGLTLGKGFRPAKWAKYILSKHHLIFFAESFWLYQDGVYAQLENEITIRQLIYNFGGDELLNRHYAEIEGALRIACYVKHSEVNRPGIMNLRNGYIDLTLSTLEFKPHTPKMLSTVQIPAEFNIDARCPMFERFLAEKVPDKELQALLQQITGYLLEPSNRLQKAFLLIGRTGTGKSTYLRILQALLGEENCSSVALDSLGERFNLAQIDGKLCNISPDLAVKGRLEDDIVKSIIGGDRLQFEQKFKDPYSGKPICRLITSTNEYPGVADVSQAFFRRWTVLPFNQEMPQKDWVDTLSDDIIERELSGVLSWALSGLEDLRKTKKLSECKASDDALLRWKLEIDSVREFADRCIKAAPNTDTSLATAFRQFTDWCINTGRKTRLTDTRFKKRLENIGICFNKKTQGVYLLDVEITPDNIDGRDHSAPYGSKIGGWGYRDYESSVH